VGVWKENLLWKPRSMWRPTSSFLMEKYTRKRWGSVFNRLGGYKRRRSPDHRQDIREDHNRHDKRIRGNSYLAHGQQSYPARDHQSYMGRCQEWNMT
jgi:hypothetical protein